MYLNKVTILRSKGFHPYRRSGPWRQTLRQRPMCRRVIKGPCRTALWALELGWPFRVVPSETSATHQPLAVVCPGRLDLECGWSSQGRNFWEGLDSEPSTGWLPTFAKVCKQSGPSLHGCLSPDSAHSPIFPSERARWPPREIPSRPCRS